MAVHVADMIHARDPRAGFIAPRQMRTETFNKLLLVYRYKEQQIRIYIYI